MATKVKEKAATAAAQNGFSLISNEKLKQLYSTMLKCRALEEHARPISKQGRFPGNHHSAIGQEATRVGVAIDLGPRDTIVPSHRSVATSFANVNGSALRDGVTLPAATPRLFKSATDVALANRKHNSGGIVVVFSGERSSSLNSWDEALVFAGRHSLPMLFVAEHDLSTEPANRKRQRTIVGESPGTKADDFPNIPVDGSDVVAVYRVAFEAIARARQGGGPTLISCNTSRSHRDPLNLMEDYLTRKGLFTSKWKKQILGNFEMELQRL